MLSELSSKFSTVRHRVISARYFPRMRILMMCFGKRAGLEAKEWREGIRKALPSRTDQGHAHIRYLGTEARVAISDNREPYSTSEESDAIDHSEKISGENS